MYRGTTPQLKFKISIPVDTLIEAYITFVQDGENVLEKTLADCDKHSDTLELRLTQDDTLKFKGDRFVEVQIRAKTRGGDAVASKIMKTYASRILKDGVI